MAESARLGVGAASGLETISTSAWDSLAAIAARGARATRAFAVLVEEDAARVVGRSGVVGEPPREALELARDAVRSTTQVTASLGAEGHALALPFGVGDVTVGAVVVLVAAPVDDAGRIALDCTTALLGVGLAEYVRLASTAEVASGKEARGAEALRDANERLRALFDASPLAIYTVDPDGSVSSWNAAAERIFGWSAAEAIGATLPIVPPDKQPEFEGLRQRMLLGEHFSELSLMRRRKDGKRLELSVSTAPLHDAAGRAVSIMAISADVTERRAVEDQLRQAQKLEALGRLAGGVAHDFNNLLAVVQAYAGLLRASLGAGDERLEQVDHILTATDRAAGVTRQLLAFGRKQVLSPVALDLNEAVQSIATLLGRVLGADVEILLDLTTGLDPVRADPTQLEQVILNLCLNARDAMPDGGRLTILTRREAPGVLGEAAVLLCVSDTGHGMDEATRQLVFEPFFTTKQGGRGTGLGLATVYGIVQQTGGQVRVESEPGRGATFRVYLPRAERMPPPPPAPPALSTPRPRTGNERVLLVEDDALVRFVTARILRESGYVVIDTPGPKEALEVAADPNVVLDALLTDIVMPEMNGQRLARAVKLHRPRLPVLYMSGYPDTSFARTGVGEGAAFIAKPFSPEALLAALRSVLEAAHVDA
jgi:PAS domain S-box-containing protein